MSDVNLLPTEAKNIIKEKRKYAFFVHIVLSFFIINTIYTIPLLIGDALLSNQFIKTIEQNSQVTLQPRNNAAAIDIVSINKKLETIATIQDQFVPWPKLIVALSEHAPEGVSYTSIQANQTNNGLQLTGNAKTRDAFLTLKANLEKDELFTNIQSPVKNILIQKDINFNLNMTLNLDIL